MSIMFHIFMISQINCRHLTTQRRIQACQNLCSYNEKTEFLSLNALEIAQQFIHFYLHLKSKCQVPLYLFLKGSGNLVRELMGCEKLLAPTC